MINTDSRAWVSSAACAGMDPDIFDVSMNTSTGISVDTIFKNAERASICDDCPVAAECAADAIAGRDRGIIRGRIPITMTCSAAWRARETTALRLVADGESVPAARGRWRNGGCREAARVAAEQQALRAVRRENQERSDA